MTSYDSSVLQENADKLYSRASQLIASYAAVGAVFAWVAIYFLEPLILSILRLPATYSLIPLQLLGAVIAAILGGVWGYGKGTALKLQAQVALCQMKIEQNTSHLEAIEQNTFLAKLEQHLSQSEDKAAVASFAR
ncbi:MAG TPA: hypothetical protein VEI73_01130 [Candidatus Acidoferrum sp.]|nr:hypothetical protein [Candidatus Acidoferrum sp.]